MRKVCISTGNFFRIYKSPYKKIDAALKLDVDGIELLFPTAKILEKFRLKRSHKIKLRKLKSNTIHVPFWKECRGNKIYFCNTPYYRKLIEKIYRIAKEINAVNINFHPYNLKNPKVLDGLEDIGYTFENMTESFGLRINDYKALLKKNPNFDFLLDTSHGIRTGQLKSLVKNFRDKIKFIHLSCAKGPKDDHYLVSRFDPKKRKQLDAIKKLKCPVIIEAGAEKGLTIKDFKKEIKFVRKWLN